MKMKPVFICGIVLFFLACKKDSEIPSNPPSDPNSTAIKMGSTSGHILLKTHNISTSDIEPAQIDINNDGIDDILFYTSMTGSLGTGGPYYEAHIKTLHNNVQLHSDFSKDSLYQKTKNTSPVLDNGVYSASRYIDISCHMENEQYEYIGGSSLNSLIPVAKDEWLKSDDSFNHGHVVYKEAVYYDVQPYTLLQEGDTTVYQYTSYQNNCISFPFNTLEYIGVKFNDSDKLAWISIRLSTDYIVEVFQSGLQL